MRFKVLDMQTIEYHKQPPQTWTDGIDFYERVFDAASIVIAVTDSSGGLQTTTLYPYRPGRWKETPTERESMVK